MKSALDKELILYFVQLNEPQKKSLLEMMKSFLQSDNKLAENATIEQYNKELDAAMERINKQEFITLEALEKEMQTW
ncbi:MAG: hypothetical protein ABJB11_01270 [Ferruginibacter sp.]